VVGPTAFDPRVLFDHSSGRWFAVSVDNQRLSNHFLVAVSRTSNPVDGWAAFSVASDPDDGFQWADFPTLGVSGDAVIVAANMLNRNSTFFDSVRMLILPKSDLLAPAPSVANRTLTENRYDLGITVQLAVHMDGLGLPSVAISSVRSTPSPGVQCIRVDGTVSSPTVSHEGTAAIESLWPPPPAPQPAIGGAQKLAINTGDDRFSGNVVLQNGHLWAVQAVEFDERTAIRWFDLAPDTCEVQQTGIISDSERSYYFPSIAVNEFGEAIIGFNGSSTSQPVSSYAVAGRTIAGNMVFGSPVLLAAGVDDYQRLDSANRNRWGDYSATVVDPSDPHVFWTFQEIVSANDQWTTQITQLRVEADTVVGDINGDARVDRTDVAVLAANFGRSGASLSTGDVNGDGLVTLGDLGIVQSHLTTPPMAAGVPEPSALLLAVGTALFLCFGVRRQLN
jgi:hypothetical protein